MLSTAGCEHMAENRSTVDGALIKVIKDSGAIIIVRGNVS